MVGGVLLAGARWELVGAASGLLAFGGLGWAVGLVNGGAQAFGQLSNKQLLALGFPREPDPVVWFTLLGLTTLPTGALVLRAVESRATRAAGPRWEYTGACATGGLGVALLALALAPDESMAIVGV